MELNRDANFQRCLPITDRKADEQYRVSLLGAAITQKS